jgi:hypothetical protein
MLTVSHITPPVRQWYSLNARRSAAAAMEEWIILELDVTGVRWAAFCLAMIPMVVF